MDGVFIDRFSAGLDDLTRKQQADMQIVLRTLERTKRFSAFEASDNDTIARTVTDIFRLGYVKDTGGGYPWTNVELTDAGRAFIAPKVDAALALRESGDGNS